MKRLWFAAVFTFIAICAGLFELFYIIQVTGQFQDQLTEARSYMEKGDTESAEEEMSEIYENWDSISSSFDILLLHDTVDEIGKNMLELKEFAKNKDAVDFYAICERTKKQLKSLGDSELPRIDNIL